MTSEEVFDFSVIERGDHSVMEGNPAFIQRCPKPIRIRAAGDQDTIVAAIPVHAQVPNRIDDRWYPLWAHLFGSAKEEA